MVRRFYHEGASYSPEGLLTLMTFGFYDVAECGYYVAVYDDMENWVNRVDREVAVAPLDESGGEAGIYTSEGL